MAEGELPTIVLSFKFRLLPTRQQHRALERILEDQRQLYNAALQERIDCHRKTGKGRTYIDQAKALTEWRAGDEDAAKTPANLQRWTIHRVDAAYNAFFRRLKKAGKAGFPRFRGKSGWRTFGFREFSGIRLDAKRLRFSSMPGGIRVHHHRPLPAGKPLSCTFTRDDKGWSVAFQMRVACEPDRDVRTVTGIDMGITHLVVLSDGSLIPNPHHAKRAEKELRRRSRALARCKKGSNRRAKVRQSVVRLHRRVSDARTTGLHQVSAYLVRQYDLIAVEKMNVKGLAGGILAKPIHDVGWSKLREFLVYKAAKAGSQVIEVSPHFTSQACSGCGVIVPKPLKVRVHSCTECGTVMDRDHNAALNILRKAVVGLEAHNVGHQPERATGNIELAPLA